MQCQTFIKTLALMVTRKCNLECEYCYVHPIAEYIDIKNAKETSNNHPKEINDNLTNNQIEELSVSEITEILRDAQKLSYNRLHIYGGEPFIRPDLEKIARSAYSMGYEVNIATNMLLITPSDYDWLRECEVSLAVNISYWDLLERDLERRNRAQRKESDNLNSVDNETIVHTQGSKNLNSPLSATKDREPLYFRQKMLIIDDLIANEIPFTVISCITKKNYGSYETFVEYMQSKGVKYFWVNYFSKLGRGKDKDDLEMSGYDWNEFISRIEHLNQYQKSGISEANISVEASYLTEKNFMLFLTDCYMQDGSKLMIDPNGNVLPCLLLVNQTKWMLGNIREESLSQLTKRLTNIWINQRFVKPKECGACNFLEKCNGGCPAYYENKENENIDYRCKHLGADGLYLTCPFTTFF